MKVFFSKKDIKKLVHVKEPSCGEVYVVGEDFYFKKNKKSNVNRLVFVTSGCLYSNGRISNHWSWTEINEDGTLGDSNSGYGNFYECPFKVKKEIKFSV